MPNDNCDLMPWNAAFREPSLIEITARPEVPEVSLLLDQDKNRSFHYKTPQSEKSERNLVKNSESEQEKNKVVDSLNGGQFVSYNTWKTKNAHLLHTITGSLRREENKNVNFKKPDSLERNQSNQKQLFYAQDCEVIDSSSISNPVPNKISRGNKPNQEYGTGVNENFAPRMFCNNDRIVIHPSKPYYNSHIENERCTEMRSNEMYPHTKNTCQYTKESQNLNTRPSHTDSHIPHNRTKVVHDEMVHPHSCDVHGTSRTPNKEMPDYVTTNPCESNGDCGMCQCRQEKYGISSSNTAGVMNRGHVFLEEAQNMNHKPSNPMLVTPFSVPQINHQTVVDLYHIIHLQNEQILMLQNQVKQMLHIHSDCGKNSVNQNFTCHKCSCQSKSECIPKGYTCTNVAKGNAVESDLVYKQNMPHNVGTSYNDTPKRSIGIMTSCLEDEVTPHAPNTPYTKGKSLKNKSKKKQQSKAAYVSPSSQKQKQPSPRMLLPGQENRNPRYTSTVKTANKEKLKTNSKVDNSFSLNEAELVIETNAEQDISPNNSVHVDLQDYNTSTDSSNSETTGSSSDNDTAESGTEGETSEPQLGWTFYNRVVGQVNNILKKDPSPSRQEQAHVPRRVLQNRMYEIDKEYDMENDWSKRVTFDGPSIESHENKSPNMMYMPSRPRRMMPNQDFRSNVEPKMMQDFMMYNIADGNTNLSFATLRLLDRYRQERNPYYDIQDPTYNGNHRDSKKQKKKKSKKYMHPEVYPHENYRRKMSGPSSNLLDITALKQQPKLF